MLTFISPRGISAQTDGWTGEPTRAPRPSRTRSSEITVAFLCSRRSRTRAAGVCEGQKRSVKALHYGPGLQRSARWGNSFRRRRTPAFPGSGDAEIASHERSRLAAPSIPPAPRAERSPGAALGAAPAAAGVRRARGWAGGAGRSGRRRPAGPSEGMHAAANMAAAGRAARPRECGAGGPGAAERGGTERGGRRDPGRGARRAGPGGGGAGGRGALHNGGAFA